jgi:hypothetical protein
VASEGGAMGAVIDAGKVKGGVGGGMGGARAVGGAAGGSHSFWPSVTGDVLCQLLKCSYARCSTSLS